MLSDLASFVVESLKIVFLSFVWGAVLFNLGRLVLLICTFGRYPHGRMLDLPADRISGVGVLFLACVWIAMAGYNHISQNGLS